MYYWDNYMHKTSKKLNKSIKPSLIHIITSYQFVLDYRHQGKNWIMKISQKNTGNHIHNLGIGDGLLGHIKQYSTREKTIDLITLHKNLLFLKKRFEKKTNGST